MGGGFGQPVLFGLELRLLARSGQASSVDFLYLVGQQFDVSDPLAGIATESLGFPQQSGQLTPGAIERPGVHAAEGVERLTLGLGDHQRPVLVLAVQLQQPGGGFGQCPYWCHSAVYPCPGTSLPGH